MLVKGAPGDQGDQLGSKWIQVIHLPIFSKLPSLVLRQSYDCPNTRDGILNNMGKISWYLTREIILNDVDKIKQNQTTRKQNTAELFRHTDYDREILKLIMFVAYIMRRPWLGIEQLSHL